MKPGINDLRFVQARTAPKWSLNMRGRPCVALALHAAINARSGYRHDTELHNALVLLGMVRRRKRDRESLTDYMINSQATGRRAVLYRRWLNKMVKTRSYESRYSNVLSVIQHLEAS